MNPKLVYVLYYSPFLVELKYFSVELAFLFSEYLISFTNNLSSFVFITLNMDFTERMCGCFLYKRTLQHLLDLLLDYCSIYIDYLLETNSCYWLV